MKKIIFGASLMLIAIGISSCGGTSSETFEFDIPTSAWVQNGTVGNSNHSYDYTKSLSAITADVVSKGAVLGYINLGSGQWGALPYTQTYGTYSRNFNFQYETGNVFIRIKDSDLNTGTPSGTITIKIVIVSQKNMELLDGVNTYNYYEVVEALHLEK